ncbi:MFS transporter [Microbacterium sp. B2969]|uniref:MFS transporter n=1 Tax=Microbacterium alkaliflavum TaxID=3248839 RepID=A0ABW7QGE1_9MICO
MPDCSSYHLQRLPNRLLARPAAMRRHELERGLRRTATVRRSRTRAWFSPRFANIPRIGSLGAPVRASQLAAILPETGGDEHQLCGNEWRHQMTRGDTERNVRQAAVAGDATATRIPLVVYALAVGTFLMLTTEFVVAGILPDVATGLQISLAQVGSLISVFAAGMIIGAPVMTILTMRLPERMTLTLALIIFAAGHIWVALASDVTQIMVARFITGVATGAFWAMAAVAAGHAAGARVASRAVGIVVAGGTLATVLGVPLGAYVSQLFGWRGTFWSLAIAASLVTVLVATLVPHEESRHASLSLGSQLAGLRSIRLWLVLLACATTTGGVLAVYSFITPILIDQSGIPASLVPLVLTGFGIGSFVGTLIAGRLGDHYPYAVTIITPAVTTLLLFLTIPLAGSALAMVLVVLLLGFFGLSANGVLIHLAVRFAGRAAPLGSALSVAAFNLGTATMVPIAGAVLESALGLNGPAVVGTVISALTLIPTTALALIARHRRVTGNARETARADRVPSP